MEYLTPAQCRAARALLGWSQPDLARRCGMHVQTISAFENETGTPTRRTLGKITDTLEHGGVEFLPNEGVGRKSNPITVLKGENAFEELLDDIFYTLQEHKGEVWISAPREPSSKEVERRELVVQHIERLKKHNIQERLLFKEGETDILAPKEWYRWQPKNFSSKNLFYLYSNKAAFVKQENASEVIIIEHEMYVQALKDLYDFTWKNAIIPQ